MNRRLSRVVATLVALSAAGGLVAGEAVILRNDRFTVPAVVADELHVERPVPAADGDARVKVAAERIAGGRDAVRAAARDLLASGAATRVAPVLYLHGQVGDPTFRATATRQIVLTTAAGVDATTLARDHGLRLVSPIEGSPGSWLAEPVSADIYAPLDAVAALGRDARAALAWPLLNLPMASRYDPNDPIYQGLFSRSPDVYLGPPGYLWHFDVAFPGIRVQEVWDTYKGEGINVAITDTGIQTDHPDLAANMRSSLSYDYFYNDGDPRPADVNDNHGTAVAGVAVAVGDNDLGGVGVAFKSSLVASKVMRSTPRYGNPSDVATDLQLRSAMRLGQGGASYAWIHVNNNSWGLSDDGARYGGPGPLMTLGLQEATINGRGGFGTVFVWAAGNGGHGNPNGAWPGGWQDCSGFDGYINRYTIGVGAYMPSTPGNAIKWTAGPGAASESGPNLSISAPGWAIGTVDRTGDNGYIVDDPLPLPPPSDFNGDNVVVATPTNQDPPIFTPPGGIFDTHPPALPFENGDYSTGFSGTSFAAAIVSGTASLMLQARPQLSWRDVRQIMWHRGQDLVGALDPGPINLLPHDPWGQWIPNAAGLQYNNWYGFGGVDVGRFVFGGTGAAANMDAATARDEPGARRWPLLPPLTANPVIYDETIPLPTVPPDRAAIYDAPENPPNQDLVPDGRPAPNVPPTRVCTIPLNFNDVSVCPIPAPARFRIEAVELTVRLSDVGITSYPPGFDPLGATGGFDWGDYQFFLTSPDGTTSFLGRQRPGGAIPEGGTWEWTFTALTHANEANVNGVWYLQILDERNNVAPDFILDQVFGNPPQARVERVGVKVYGHQTYEQPGLSALSRPAVASGSGSQTVELTGSGFAISQGRVGVTTAYWDPDGLAGPTAPVELPTTFINGTRVRVTIPEALIPTASPGSAYLTLANPAIVVGRAGGIDDFDTPNVLLPTNNPAGTDRYMKRCPDADEKEIRYSRPPVVAPIADIYLTSGGAFSFSVSVTDADAEAGLPVAPATPETVSVSLVSFNPYFVTPASFVVGGPVGPFAGVGSGVYTITGSTTGSNSGFAYIELRATDGVITTVRPFRVVIPSDEDGSGCAGGMGLALLGVPLGVWLIRRRRRSA